MMLPGPSSHTSMAEGTKLPLVKHGVPKQGTKPRFDYSYIKGGHPARRDRCGLDLAHTDECSQLVGEICCHRRLMARNSGIRVVSESLRWLVSVFTSTDMSFSVRCTRIWRPNLRHPRRRSKRKGPDISQGLFYVANILEDACRWSVYAAAVLHQLGLATARPRSTAGLLHTSDPEPQGFQPVRLVPHAATSLS